MLNKMPVRDFLQPSVILRYMIAVDLRFMSRVQNKSKDKLQFSYCSQGFSCKLKRQIIQKILLSKRNAPDPY